MGRGPSTADRRMPHFAQFKGAKGSTAGMRASDPWARRFVPCLLSPHTGSRGHMPASSAITHSLPFEIATCESTHLRIYAPIQLKHLEPMYTPAFTGTVSARQPFNPTKAHMNRCANMLARLLLALMLVAAAMPGPAVAQESQRPGTLSRNPDRNRQGGAG